MNYIAIVAAAVASMVIGSLWYGPLFGKTYMRAMGMGDWNKKSDAEKKAAKRSMMWSYLWQFVASLVMFYVLARVTNGLTLTNAIGVAVWAWVGFVVPLKLGDALWGGKMTLFWLGISNMFVTLVVGAAILGYWH